jgi:hypothetical protein
VDTPEVAIARYAADISLWALYVSGGSLVIASSVLLLEVRRWFEEGPKPIVSLMADAKTFGGISMGEDDNTYIAANVTNRGNAPTSITHMVILNYPTWGSRWLPWRLLRLLKWRQKQFFIVSTGIPGPIPYHLEQGRQWVGMAKYTDDLEAMIAAGHLYIGIIASHRGRTHYRRVPRPRKLSGAKALET